MALYKEKWFLGLSTHRPIVTDSFEKILGHGRPGNNERITHQSQYSHHLYKLDTQSQGYGGPCQPFLITILKIKRKGDIQIVNSL